MHQVPSDLTPQRFPRVRLPKYNGHQAQVVPEPLEPSAPTARDEAEEESAVGGITTEEKGAVGGLASDEAEVVESYVEEAADIHDAKPTCQVQHLDLPEECYGDVEDVVTRTVRRWARIQLPGTPAIVSVPAMEIPVNHEDDDSSSKFK